MEDQIEIAKKEIQKLGESILSQIPSDTTEDPIEQLNDKVNRLQSFLEIFPPEAAKLFNEHLANYESEFGVEETEPFREKLTSISQNIFFEFRDFIMK